MSLYSSIYKYTIDSFVCQERTMLTFRQFIIEELRSGKEAQDIFDRFQKKKPRSLPSIVFGGIHFGTGNPLAGGKQQHPIISLLNRIRHYPDDPRKRSIPVRKTINIKSLRPTQPGIQNDVVKHYIKYYSDHPEEAKKATIHTYPGTEKGTYDIGDGHHRAAALRSLGYDKINVLHHER